MRRLTRWSVGRGLGLLLLVQGCAHTERVRIEVPPRVDLATWPTLGIVEFRGTDRPELGSLATTQFVEMLHAAQAGARILELGSEPSVLAEVGCSKLDFAAARAIGEHFGVDAVFTGSFALTRPKPTVILGRALESLDASAEVHGLLDVRLLEAQSGASVWSARSDASAHVASFGLSKGALPTFDVSDPRDAYAELVRRLVDEQRYDFYPTWREQ
jgi:hypothetical protein